MNGPSHPLVSVLIPTYNRLPLVLEALDSVLAQEFNDFEIIVVDDGSTDGTSERLQHYHPTLRLLTTERRERCAARNHGIRNARGRFIAFLDSDDVFEPWHLAQFSDALGRHPEGRLFASAHLYWEQETGRTRAVPALGGRPENLVDRLLQGTLAPTSALIAERDALVATGDLPETPGIPGSEDWVICSRLAPRFGMVAMPRPSVRIRYHPGRSMQNAAAMIRSREMTTRFIADEGFGGTPLTEDQVRVLWAGTHRFAYANHYGAGDMRAARARLREIRRDLRGWKGIRWTARYWAQTWLGVSGSRLLRRAKVMVSWQQGDQKAMG